MRFQVRHVVAMLGMSTACLVIAIGAATSVVADVQPCTVDGVLVVDPSPDVICDSTAGSDASSGDSSNGDSSGVESGGGESGGTGSGMTGTQEGDSNTPVDGGGETSTDVPIPNEGDDDSDESTGDSPHNSDEHSHRSESPHRSRTGSGRSHSVRHSHRGRPSTITKQLVARFTPRGRIPDIRHMRTRDMRAITAGADTAGSSWSTLAAVAWLDTRWGRTSKAHHLVGTRMSRRDWLRFGTDGSGDGLVQRTSAADQCATVATFLVRNHRAGLRRYLRRPALVRRARYLAAYYDALGRRALTHGLSDSDVRSDLSRRVLANDRLFIYSDGRSDIDAGRIDPRVMVLLQFLSHRYRSVTVSSLETGHGFFTRSGRVSLHSYGQAVDIAAINGQHVMGHQSSPSSLTVRVLKDVLRMPRSMQPRELISLWSLGGPSFSMADHDDHIHVGFATIPE